MYGNKKCARCGRPATFKFTRIEDGSVNDIFLCNEHAAETSKYQKPATHLSDILQGLLKQEFGSKAAAGQSAPADLECKHCGLPFEAYRRNLMLGCSSCYEAFHDFLIADLRKFHGETRHVGRRPGGATVDPNPLKPEEVSPSVISIPPFPASLAPLVAYDRSKELLRLQKQMQIAIAEKNYLRAAKLRDHIKTLKETLKQDEEQG
jgi:protein arginine kinase activator